MGPLRTSSSGRDDEVLPEAPYGEGPIGAFRQRCRDALSVWKGILAGVCYRRLWELAGLGGLLLEHLCGRARIGGQPVEVFFREGFGRVSGREDYPDYAVLIEDRNRK